VEPSRPTIYCHSGEQQCTVAVVTEHADNEAPTTREPRAPSGPSGLETLKVLRASANLPVFTVAALADYAGVDRSTVSTVLNRYAKKWFELDETHETDDPAGPKRVGRPPNRWRLRPDRIDEVADKVQSIRLNLPDADREEIDLSAHERESLLASATDALLRTEEADPNDVPHLVSIVRDAVATARENAPAEDSDRARSEFLECLASVVEAQTINDPAALDHAQARAFESAVAASTEMAAHEWIGLVSIALRAPGSVKLAPVLVEASHEHDVRARFPALAPDNAFARPKDGFVRLHDRRVEVVIASDVYLAFVDDTHLVEEHEQTVFVAERPESLLAVLKYHAPMVVDRGTADIRSEIAELVNRYGLGLATRLR
jgi:hypothetical protein